MVCFLTFSTENSGFTLTINFRGDSEVVESFQLTSQSEEVCAVSSVLMFDSFFTHASLIHHFATSGGAGCIGHCGGGPGHKEVGVHSAGSASSSALHVNQ